MAIFDVTDDWGGTETVRNRIQRIGGASVDKADNGPAIQAVIDECAANGGGTVYASVGGNLKFSGGLVLKEGVRFLIDRGTVLENTAASGDGILLAPGSIIENYGEIYCSNASFSGACLAIEATAATGYVSTGPTSTTGYIRDKFTGLLGRGILRGNAGQGVALRVKADSTGSDDFCSIQWTEWRGTIYEFNKAIEVTCIETNDGGTDTAYINSNLFDFFVDETNYGWDESASVGNSGGSPDINSNEVRLHFQADTNSVRVVITSPYSKNNRFSGKIWDWDTTSEDWSVELRQTGNGRNTGDTVDILGLRGTDITQVYQCSISGVTGTPAAGDTFTGGTSGTTGYVVDTNGTTYIRATRQDGEITGSETLTFSPSGATATASSPNRYPRALHDIRMPYLNVENADFGAIGDILNTTHKFGNRRVRNYTTGVEYIALGDWPESDWKPVDGGTAITPA